MFREDFIVTKESLFKSIAYIFKFLSTYSADQICITSFKISSVQRSFKNDETLLGESGPSETLYCFKLRKLLRNSGSRNF